MVVSPARKKILEWLPVAGAGLVLGVGTFLNRGYLKDDAFISYRFARNLVDGHGMVFNVGERVEGYTNFLWVVLHAPVLWLGLDPVAWSSLLGGAAAAGTVVLAFLAARRRGGGGVSVSSWVAPWIVACSSSVALWSMSGMAPCLVMFFGTGAVAGLWRSLEEGGGRSWLWTGLAMAGAALTRPEGHLFFVVGVAAVAVATFARRAPPRGVWTGAAAFAVVIAPYHLWRLWYFGDLLPLTYYAKGSGGPEVWGMGLGQVAGLMAFHLNAVVAALGLVSLIPRRGRGYRAIPVALWLLFLVYMVKIGVDEMIYYRLFLPVYGAFALSAGEGFRVLWSEWKPRRGRALVRAAAVVAVGAVAVSSVRLTLSATELHHDYRAMMEASSMAMGRHILERSAPDDAVVFQDLGACPWAAYPLRFVDPIGVLNPFVAGELARRHINPFLREATAARPGGREALEEFDRTVRDHLFEQDARWVGLVAYLEWRPDAAGIAFRQRLDAALGRRDAPEVARLLAPYLAEDRLSCGLYRDPRFHERYALAGVWRRSSAHYLALFERRRPDAGG